MFLHIGNDRMINADDIVAILDEPSLFSNKKNIEFVESQHYSEEKFRANQQNTKSIIVTEQTVYLSPFSSVTLKRHIERNRSV